MAEDSLAMQVYKELRQELSAVNQRVDALTNRTERAEYTDGIVAFAHADLPTNPADGTAYITLVWVSDGRKSGEGAGAGTGVLAVYSNGNWLRTSDYATVSV
jgi:hypothetical protein